MEKISGNYITYQRRDFLVNTDEEDHPLKCSIYDPENEKSDNLMIYNHCFSGNKLEAMFLIDYLNKGYSLLTYDMRGAGNNQSKYVTLGLRESEDLDRIMDYVESEGLYKNVVLWGWSMGAVCVIHYLHYLDYHILTMKVNKAKRKNS